MLYFLLVSNILMLGIFIFKFNGLPPQVPLYYSRPIGEDQLADFWMLILLPIIMNALYFLNIFVYRRYFVEHELVKKIFLYTNLFLIISITAIFIKIITLVS